VCVSLSVSFATLTHIFRHTHISQGFDVVGFVSERLYIYNLVPVELFYFLLCVNIACQSLPYVNNTDIQQSSDLQRELNNTNSFCSIYSSVLTSVKMQLFIVCS